MIGTAKDASSGDWIKVCAIYDCKKCQGKKFDAKNHDRPQGGGKNGGGTQPSGKNDGGKSHKHCPKEFTIPNNEPLIKEIFWKVIQIF